MFRGKPQVDSLAWHQLIEVVNLHIDFVTAHARPELQEVTQIHGVDDFSFEGIVACACL